MIKSLGPALRAFLLDDAQISAMVGGVRIYPSVLEQGVRQPSIVYRRITEVGDHHMKGPSGLTGPRMQIDCWAQDPDQAEQLANLVKARLDGYRGPMAAPGSPPDVIAVQGIFFDSSRDDYDGTAELYRVSRDYFVMYEER